MQQRLLMVAGNLVEHHLVGGAVVKGYGVMVKPMLVQQVLELLLRHPAQLHLTKGFTL